MIRDQIKLMSQVPITWKELEKYHLKTPDKEMYRHPKVQKAYDEFLEILSKQNLSINKYVLEAIFSDEYYSRPFIITKNKFPYNIEEKYAHLLIWLNPLYEVEESEILLFLKEKCEGNPFILFKNDPQNSSVCLVTHYHLFVNKEYENVLCNIEVL